MTPNDVVDGDAELDDVPLDEVDCALVEELLNDEDDEYASESEVVEMFLGLASDGRRRAGGGGEKG